MALSEIQIDLLERMALPRAELSGTVREAVKDIEWHLDAVAKSVKQGNLVKASKMLGGARRQMNEINTMILQARYEEVER